MVTVQFMLSTLPEEHHLVEVDRDRPEEHRISRAGGYRMARRVPGPCTKHDHSECRYGTSEHLDTKIRQCKRITDGK